MSDMNITISVNIGAWLGLEAVYGEPDEALLPLLETAPKAPANPYGTSKLAAEGMLAQELLGFKIWTATRWASTESPC